MWLATYPVDVARSIFQRRRLRFNSPLLEDLQAEIIRSYRRLCRSKGTKEINLLGYKIFFMSEGPLRYLFDEIFMRASYFFKASSDCPVIFDCGSNIGMSILFFKKLYPNARIVAFEPDPFTFELYDTMLMRIDLSNVDLHQIALSDRSGTIELFRDASPQSSSLVMSTLRRRHDGPGVTVPAQRLSDFISSEIDLLKLDIEGAEDAVMGDLASTGKLRQIKRLHLEYHHHIDASADKLSTMLQLIENNGFGYQLRTSYSAVAV